MTTKWNINAVCTDITSGVANVMDTRKNQHDVWVEVSLKYGMTKDKKRQQQVATKLGMTVKQGDVFKRICSAAPQWENIKQLVADNGPVPQKRAAAIKALAKRAETETVTQAMAIEANDHQRSLKTKADAAKATAQANGTADAASPITKKSAPGLIKRLKAAQSSEANAANRLPQAVIDGVLALLAPYDAVEVVPTTLEQDVSPEPVEEVVAVIPPGAGGDMDINELKGLMMMMLKKM